MAIGELRRERACAAVLASLHEWTLRIEAPAYAGGVARGELSASGCRRRATVIVESGRGEPGDVLRVSGKASANASPDARSMMVQGATIQRIGADSPLPRLRARAGARIDALFGADAPIVRALVIADMSAIDPAQRDAYADAGLVHMLSVSGLHVGIIAFALELLGAALRLPRGPVRVGTLALLTVYVIAIGAPPPAVRAAVMLGVLLASRMRQRPTSPWAVLALGALVPLVTPRIVLDLGWQLSVAGTSALIAGGCPEPPRRSANVARHPAIARIRRDRSASSPRWSPHRSSRTGSGASRSSGPVTNLLADPVMGVLQPLLFVALCIPIGFVERLCTDAAHALLLAFDGIARLGAAVPGGALAITPTTIGALLAGVAATAVLVACASPRPVRAAVVSVGAVALLVVAPLVAPASPMTELHMLDVGQGDAIALRTRAGHWILIDAGRSWIGGDAGKSTIVPYLAHRGGTVVAVRALASARRSCRRRGVHVRRASPASLSRSWLRRHVGPVSLPHSPRRLEVAFRGSASGQATRWCVDEVVLTALAPDSAWVAGLTDANLASTVLVARVGTVRMLLTGDAEEPEERWLLERDPSLLAADILKVAHHGSRTSTTPAFLDAVRPRLALVSVGAHNAYGHPNADVMQRLHDAGAQVLRTDRAGTIVVRTDGRRIEVEARAERWTIPERADQ